MNAQVIAVVNQKGGTGKSTTCANLGIGLAQAGKKVLVVDVDPQASLSISLGHSQPDDLPVTLSDLMGKVLNDQPIAPGEGILHHAEGVDLMPSNIQLSGMEVSLVNAMSRETILRQYLDTVRKQYTHILLDCQPSLGMLKCRYMDEITGGRGVVFATGTPVSNSMTELFTMQRYLQQDLLDKGFTDSRGKHYSLNHFDS